MLPSEYRIPRQEIALLLRRGLRVRGDGAELVYSIQNTVYGIPTPRFSFIVSTKVDKRATARNRIRRLMSEAVRLYLKTQNDSGQARMTDDIDGIFVARRDAVGKTQEEIRLIVEQLFSKAMAR